MRPRPRRAVFRGCIFPLLVAGEMRGDHGDVVVGMVAGEDESRRQANHTRSVGRIVRVRSSEGIIVVEANFLDG